MKEETKKILVACVVVVVILAVVYFWGNTNGLNTCTETQRALDSCLTNQTILNQQVSNLSSNLTTMTGKYNTCMGNLSNCRHISATNLGLYNIDTFAGPMPLELVLSINTGLIALAILVAFSIGIDLKPEIKFKKKDWKYDVLVAILIVNALFNAIILLNSVLHLSWNFA